jgi:hypothetical protein
MDQRDRKTAVMISEDLYEQLKEIIRGTGFSSVDDYVGYILRTQVGKNPEKQQGDLSEEDTEVVTSRLKALGYI